MVYKHFHRITGVIVSVFIVAHLFNHGMAWFGIATHQRILDTLRVVYRQPLVEVLLVGSFLFQSFSGIMLVRQLKAKQQRTTFEKIQIYSGIVLGLFIVQHITATIGQRMYFGFDTNFYFASRVVLQYPFKLYFVPYYFLGVMAFGLHIANVHRNKMNVIIGNRQANFHFWVILSIFSVIISVILYVLMGSKYDIIIPSQYQVY